jgi:hypothetical protein
MEQLETTTTNSNLPFFQLPVHGKIHTLHVLKSGTIISSFEAFREVEDRFSWVNKADIISKILRLQKLTDEHKQSVVVVYEDGQQIKEFLNVSNWFNPLVD